MSRRKPRAVSATAVEARPTEFAVRDRPPHPSAGFHAGAIALILALVVVGYSGTLRADFHLDDSKVTSDRALHLRSLDAASLGRVLVHRRPVASLTFALNYYTGGHNVAGYHLVNIAIHSAVALTLYVLMLELARLPGLRARIGAYMGPFALAAAALWAIHPVQTQAVTYIVQRMTGLAALFYLLALIAYLRGRTASGSRRVLWWTGTVVAGALALGSKELAATLPFAIVMVEVCLIGEWNRRTLGFAVRWTAGLAVPILLVAVLAAQGEGNGSFWAQLLAHRSNSQWFTVTEHLLTEGRVLVHYLTLLALPHPDRLTFDYGFAVSHGLLDPPTTLPAWLLVLGVIGWALAGVRRRPLVAFGVLWFFLHLAIESSLIPLDLAFEHRLYLPSMGAAFLLALGGVALWKRTTRFRYIPIVAFAGLLGAWTAWTVERNAVWATELTLWTDTAAKAPSNPRALSSLGQAYLIRGETDRALEWLQAAIRANPDFYNAHGHLGQALMAKGDPEGALAAFERGRVLAPDKVPFTYLVGIASQALGRWEDARHAYIETLRLNPEAAEAHMNLGAIDLQAGRWDNALIEYQAAYRLDPNLPEVTYGMGRIFQYQGRLDDAAGAYRETIRNDSSHVNAHIALAGVYVAQEKKPEAVETFEAALHLAPDVPEGHFQVARLLEDIGRSTEALAHYRRFITLATPSQAKALEWAKRQVAQIEAASAPGAPP